MNGVVNEKDCFTAVCIVISIQGSKVREKKK
jgi:hypothetical protein